MKKSICILLAVLMVVSLAACGKTDPGTKPVQEAATEPGGNSELSLGALDTDGAVLTVGENTFTEGSAVTLNCDIPADVLNETEKYEALGKGAEISADEFDGTFFATDVILTAALPAAVKNSDEELERYVFVCKDGLSGETRYFEPTSINSEEGTMSIRLPHFSFWKPAKLTPEEEKKQFLDAYSTKLAVAQLGNDRAAEETGPYVQARIDAMGLTAEAAEELKKAVIKELGGLAFDDAGELGAAAFNSKAEDGYQTFTEELDSKIVGALNDMLKTAGATKAATLFQSIDKTSKIAGYLAGGDTESALKEVGGLMEDAIPMGSVITKAVGYVGAQVNECFTNWKANEVEELYNIYKNGAEDFWHNEVIARDWNSMSTYLNASSGFTMAKAVNRFYNLDKVEETCKKYGWSFKTYEEMPEKYKEEFNKRAEEGLRNYFETRLAQEEAAAKIREQEEQVINDMLSGAGALRSGFYTEFFGEKSRDDYSLTNRLNRLVHVRSFISQFVDEEALARQAKNGGHTYGSLLNEWVRLYNDSMDDRDSVIKDFTKFLEESELLNPLYKPAPALDGAEAFTGEWHKEDGSRKMLYLSGSNLIEEDPDLPWYGGDICCTEYTVEFDAAKQALILTGVTSWTRSPEEGTDARHLEIDATTVHMTVTATEIADGKATKITIGTNTYTR